MDNNRISTDINYSDGEIESEILASVKSSESLDSSTSISPEKHSNWAFEYHLSHKRANLLRHLSFKGLEVLEIGAGMGAITRYLAENSEHVTVVEGTKSRAEVLKERVRDLRNVSISIGDFKAFTSEKKFDRVVVIGVLEYADVIWGGEKPFHRFLAKCFEHLKFDGQLILAIENRLGFKYFNGATEDHTARLFDGVAGYDGPRSPRTFSKFELMDIFKSSGFSNVRFSYPVPDYKMPKGVLQTELHEINPALFKELSLTSYSRDYSGHRSELIPDELFTNGLCEGRLLDQFSNSFLIQATGGEEPVPGEHLAVLYSSTNSPYIQTTFTRSGADILVTKNVLSGSVESEYLRWIKPPIETVRETRTLEYELLRASYFSNQVLFDELWNSYIGLLIQLRDGVSIPPSYWDLLPRNIILSPSRLIPIDQEWQLKRNLELSYLAFRAVLSLNQYTKSYICERHETLSAFYKYTCAQLNIEPQLETSIRLEIEVQQSIHSGGWSFDSIMSEFNTFRTPHVRSRDLGKQLAILERERAIVLNEQIRLNREVDSLNRTLTKYRKIPGFSLALKLKKLVTSKVRSNG